MIKTEKNPRILSFVQAAKEFKHLIDEKELGHAKVVANRFFKGELEGMFIVLSDSPTKQNDPQSEQGTSSGAGPVPLVNFRTPVRNQSMEH